MISACISVKLGLQPYSKGVFECDYHALTLCVKTAFDGGKDRNASPYGQA